MALPSLIESTSQIKAARKVLRVCPEYPTPHIMLDPLHFEGSEKPYPHRKQMAGPYKLELDKAFRQAISLHLHIFVKNEDLVS